VLAVSVVEVNKDISLDDVYSALSGGLGPRYRTSVLSGSSLKVMRNVAVWGVVHVTWSGDRTSFRVRPGGLILVAAFNAVYTAPKIRRALARAFPQAA
jgi:hypothetical protein